ncbi:hypothetical protein GCM10022376_26640 [Yimella lutea]
MLGALGAGVLEPVSEDEDEDEDEEVSLFLSFAAGVVDDEEDEELLRLSVR